MADTDPAPQKVTTFLMFQGRAEEVMALSVSRFADGDVLHEAGA